MDHEKVKSISDRYIELYEKITGKPFEKENHENIYNRVENNVLEALKTI
jgi:phosphoribosylaminoimidazole-succinocarboxamide synthase